MTRFIVRRVAMAIPVLVGVSLLVFSVLYLIPGDPAQILLFGSNATPAQLEQLRQQLGLNRPLPVQYVIYLGHIIRGDLGRSFQTQQPVASELAARFPSTLRLTLAGMFVAMLLGIPMGIIAGLRPKTWLDRASMGIAVLGIAVPFFWLALLLVLVFAVKLDWLPSLGVGSLKAIILPAVSLGVGYAAASARLLRNNLIEVYEQPYMQAARAKGLSNTRLLFRHAMKNALIPVVTILGLQFGNMLSGAVVIEVIFGRPGIGTYLISAIQTKDIPAVQGTVLFIAVLYIGINLLVDITYGLLDPRIRMSWARSG